MPQRTLSILLTLAVGAVGGAAGAVGVLTTTGASLAGPGSRAAAPSPVRLAALPAPVTAAGDPEPIADLVDRVAPAVVNIDTVSRVSAPRMMTGMPFPFGDSHGFFGDPRGGEAPMEVQKGIGSGFVVRPDGLIVTNFHVVRGAQQLTVTFADGRHLPGKVVGRDPGEDLALVHVDAHDLPVLQLADPHKVRVGQYVVAIGSPLGYSHTVTAGIVSATNREVGDLNARIGFLQTDAPINPGNSGGPLLNLQGQVVGVNTAIAAQAQGIGFAIPVDTLSRAIPQLETRGSVRRAWLGVGVRDLPADRSKMFYPADHGAVVAQVTPGSPAAKAGLQEGDVLVQLDGQDVQSAGDVVRRIGNHQVGDAVKLLVEREGQRKAFSFGLGEMPDKLADDGR